MNKYNIFKILTAAVLLTLIVFPAAAQNKADDERIKIIEESYNSNQPAWLLMERGKQAFNLGEYGLASRIFREIISRKKVSPDADLWLAYIFVQEGEYQLAEKQYLKALENKSQLYIPEDEFTILYDLSEIYKKLDQYGKYEKTLLQIIEKDDSDEELRKLQYSMLDVLKERGVDKMLELYRYTNNKYNRARTELGVFYYRTGRYNDAELNLILPFVSIAATGFDYIYNETADYEYSKVYEHVKNMLEYTELKDFLVKNDFFRSVYYLAASLYADGYSVVSQNLWQLVALFDSEGSGWKIRAQRQLENPFIEPIISQRS